MASVLPFAIPGPLLAAGAPEAAGPDAGGISDPLTSTVPPFDSRNATSAQICCGDRILPISGMIGSYPGTTKARGFVSDSYRYALQSLPASRLPQRAPMGPCPFSSVKRFGARVPRPWHAVH